MRLLNTIILALILLFFFNSCKKDDPQPEKIPYNQTQGYKDSIAEVKRLGILYVDSITNARSLSRDSIRLLNEESLIAERAELQRVRDSIQYETVILGVVVTVPTFKSSFLDVVNMLLLL